MCHPICVACNGGTLPRLSTLDWMSTDMDRIDEPTEVGNCHSEAGALPTQRHREAAVTAHTGPTKAHDVFDRLSSATEARAKIRYEVNHHGHRVW